MTLLALACRSESAPTSTSETAAPPAATDARADDVTPTRIVSLAPSLTEITYDLGLGERVVGVSDFDTWPPEVKDKEKLGGLLNPNLEKLASLEPDLVLVHASSGKVADHARKLDIKTLALATDTLADIHAGYRAIGKATGKLEEAEARVAALTKELDGLEPEPNTKRPTVLLVVGRTPGSTDGITAAGEGTFLDEVLEAVGGVNAAPEGRPWPQVSREYLLGSPPDLVVELRPEPLPDDELTTIWRKFEGFAPAREGRIVQVTGDHVLIPGPRYVKTARQLRDALKTLEKE